jgi:hypothetical protein
MASVLKHLSHKNPLRLLSRNYLVYLLILKRYAASAFESAASASSAIPALRVTVRFYDLLMALFPL